VRIVKSLVAMGAVAATATALAVAPALADPVNGHLKRVTPQPYDVVTAGSATTQYVLDGLSLAYNKTVKHHGVKNPYLLSWDAVPPNNPNFLTQKINTKAGCSRQLRPAGSSAGITDMGTYGTVKYKGKTYPCINFARSSRFFKTGDPVFGPGGISFVILAKDAVTYASTKVTNVPKNLTTAQLTEIFSCNIPANNGDPKNSWGALVGNIYPTTAQDQALVAPVLPQSGSGTLSFFTGVIGVATTEPTCGPAAALPATQDPLENEGVDNVFRIGDVSTGAPNPNVIYPFSIGDYLAQSLNSPLPGHKPKKGQNAFGHDETGVLYLNELNGTQPTVFTGSGKHRHLITNPKFSSPFQRYIYDVTPYSSDKTHIPANLEKWLDPANIKGAPHGFFCANAQHALLEAYGFTPTAACGLAS